MADGWMLLVWLVAGMDWLVDDCWVLIVGQWYCWLLLGRGYLRVDRWLMVWLVVAWAFRVVGRVYGWLFFVLLALLSGTRDRVSLCMMQSTTKRRKLRTDIVG